MPLITTKGAASAQGFGEFTKTSEPVYIESCFSTYLYTGNGSTQTITNNIDLSTKGGLVWIKCRNRGDMTHALNDTNRGVRKYLATSSAAAEVTNGGGNVDLYAYNTNGFNLGPSNFVNVNDSGEIFVSWTFRKQPKFFDVVTYTGDGATSRNISHALGSAPGFIAVKRTSGTGDWWCYHRSLGTGNRIFLNYTYASSADADAFATVSSAVFSVSTGTGLNDNGATYVAYLFAHDAGGFGLSGTDNVISCGSYTGNGSATGPVVTLGWEPQWLMIKEATVGGVGRDWLMFDNMRGMFVNGASNPPDPILSANLSSAESTGGGTYLAPTATGFNIESASGNINGSGNTYIYIAIRRGPMKVPTSGTSVFSPVVRTGTNAAATVTTGNLPDWVLIKGLSGSDGNNYSRLTGPNRQLYTNKTLQEIDQGAGYGVTAFLNTAFTLGLNANNENANGVSIVNYAFTRAPGFFDVVCYTGTGSATSFSHNLGVAPQMVIVKSRANVGGFSQNWIVNHYDISSYDAYLNSSSLFGATKRVTATSSTTFTVTTDSEVNASGTNYVAYLFATVAGVSKVGSYTGTGTTLQIDCGFTGGARFILIKRTDSTGDWYVYDTARGIVAGNDPYLFLNSTAAEATTTDYIDPYNAGFELSSTAPAGLNANGGTFVFLAVA